ncbi:hypothetical protein DFH09DRAFT_1115026 [Mycena vulgaris]|nr:hypothetical protein DFH09DRAFT_1115026 [Mycena vulgaris]
MRDGYGTAKLPSMPSTCGRRPLTAAYGLGILLGRQAESGWTSESYNKVVVALKDIGVIRSSTGRQVKSCWTRLKGRYKIMKEMLGLSGFGYDAKTKSVTATEEVWDAYLALFTAVDQTQEIMIDRFPSVKIDRHQPSTYLLTFAGPSIGAQKRRINVSSTSTKFLFPFILVITFGCGA